MGFSFRIQGLGVRRASRRLRSAVSRARYGCGRVLSRLKEFHADQNELNERFWLLNHPWEECFLHWVGDGQDARLHGNLLPPSDGRRHSVTRRGWCQRRTARELDRS